MNTINHNGSGNIGTNLLEVIRRGKLGEFIMGRGEFQPLTQYPEEGYRRWNELKSFYAEFADQPEVRTKIKQEVLHLFDVSDDRDKYASVVLSRLLFFPEIEEKIHKSIFNGNFFHFSPHLQKEILIAISELTLDDLAAFEGEMVVKMGILEEYLTYWTNPPLKKETKFSHNDFWRINSIALYYSTLNPNGKSQIIQSIIDISERRPNLVQLLIAYTANDPMDSMFKQELRRQLLK